MSVYNAIFSIFITLDSCYSTIFAEVQECLALAAV